MATPSMAVESPVAGRALWLRWAAVNTVGIVLAMLSVSVIDSVGGDDGSLRDGLSHLIGLGLAGAVVGLLQWAVLRRRIRRAVWGVLSASISLPIGFLLGFVVGGPPMDFFGSFLMLGILGGITYWLVLRLQVRRAGWWVLASSLGWALGGVAALVVAIGLGDAVAAAVTNETLGFLVILGLLGIAGGLVGGTITGAALARLLQHPAAGARY